MRRLCLLPLLVALLPEALCYMYFLDKIPNGRKVPHPCKPNELWEGVGHYLTAGTGQRNPFGVDFEAADETWTVELCRKDSDGDGRTNGEELGDPTCVWKPGTLPTTTSGLSHPGVCESTDRTVCKLKTFANGLYRTQEEWMAAVCKYDGFVCDGLDSPDVKNQTLRIPRTPVPAKDTTYMCGIFEFANNSLDAHLIATTAIIDNRNVMHHIVMFGCTGETGDKQLGQPFECGMTAHENCSMILSIWTVGQNGECYHKDSGIRVGLNGFQRVALQFHWNNPLEEANYTDSSGMTLYYTTNRRPNDAAILMIGDQNFVVPPGETRYSVQSTCTSACTSSIMSRSVYVTAAWNHMHYAGVSQTIQHYRNGTFLQYITNDDTYSYDSPKTHIYATPLEVRPGDELKTTCYYNTEGRNTSVFFGEATREEMCYGFVYYYPKQAIDQMGCVTFQSTLSFCDSQMMGSCNFQSFLTSIVNSGSTFQKVTSRCEYFGRCLKECKLAIGEVRASEPCMSHEVWWGWAKQNLKMDAKGIRFLGSLASCEAQMAVDDAQKMWPKQLSVTPQATTVQMTSSTEPRVSLQLSVTPQATTVQMTSSTEPRVSLASFATQLCLAIFVVSSQFQ